MQQALLSHFYEMGRDGKGGAVGDWGNLLEIAWTDVQGIGLGWLGALIGHSPWPTCDLRSDSERGQIWRVAQRAPTHKERTAGRLLPTNHLPPPFRTATFQSEP